MIQKRAYRPHHATEGIVTILNPVRTLALMLLLPLATTATASLQSDAERTIRKQGIELGDVGVAVLDPSTGQLLVDINASTPRIPASNMKLLTSGAAARLLGADFRYRTRLVGTDDDLVVIGSGDPAFGDSELLDDMIDADGNPLDVESFLDLWVDAIEQSGRRAIDELIVDDRIFDREYVHSTWPTGQLTFRYCAGVAGVNFHRNIIRFYPHPGRTTADVSRRSPATDGLDIRNRITSRTIKNKSDVVDIHRTPGTNTITLKGNVTSPIRTPVEVTVHDMPSLFGTMLAERLADRGITVDTVRLATDSDPQFNGDPIGPVIATPIQRVLERCNHDSNNLYAEALLKTLGAAYTREPGSYENGATVIRHVVQDQLSTPDTTLRVADGSGMSRANHVAPATIARWLGSFDPAESNDATFIASLPSPGEGTLSKRFRSRDLSGTTVMAKSGFLNGVCSLSGYVFAPDGRRLAFSIIVNDSRTPASTSKVMQEKIVERLASSLAALARG